MRVSSIAGSLLTLCALALPAATVGQTIPSNYEYIDTRQEAGLVVGAADLAAGRFGFGPSGGTMLGGRWGIGLTGPLGFDVAASVLDGERDVVDPARAEGQRVTGQADVLLGLVDARLVFALTGNRTWRGMQPYLQAGGGMAFDLAASDPADDAVLPQDRFDFGTSFLGTAGAGSRLFLTDRLVLRGDAIFSLFRVDTPPGFSDPERGFENVEESEWVSGLSLSLSAGIRF